MFLSSEVIPSTITNHYAISVTMAYEFYINQPILQKRSITFLHNEADHDRMLLDLKRQLSSTEYYDVPNVEIKK